MTRGSSARAFSWETWGLLQPGETHVGGPGSSLSAPLSPGGSLLYPQALSSPAFVHSFPHLISSAWAPFAKHRARFREYGGLTDTGFALKELVAHWGVAAQYDLDCDRATQEKSGAQTRLEGQGTVS